MHHLLYILGWMVFLSLLENICEAQEDIRFQRITTEDGLANNTVLSIDQDKYGRIWIATYDGLTVFDGYSYKKHLSCSGKISKLNSKRTSKTITCRFDRPCLGFIRKQYLGQNDWNKWRVYEI
ncbi:MAG: hypothetical protein HC831_07390 [Chloroflexia bacterium]|nr:hypothetical protein [Chloroflexia bacterium]